MQLQINTPALISFISYLLVVMSIGMVAYFLTRNLSDYVLGGRRLGGAVAALSAGASDMSSWLLMGLPGAVYLFGLQQIWLPIGLIVGAYLSWFALAKPLRIYSEVANDSLTIPAFLDNRFLGTCSKPIRVVSGLAVVVFFIFYIASGLVAGGLLLSRTFHLNYQVALALGTGIIMLYTLIGGFLAVSWTDFFQGTLMLGCLLIVPYLALTEQGGWQAVYHELQTSHPGHVIWGQIQARELINLLAWGFGYFGMPHILVRFMAVKTVHEIPLARRICMGWMFFSLVGAIAVGLVGVVWHLGDSLTHHEMVFMALAEQVFPLWFVGMLMAAILSSSMCAIDSQMLAASSALTEDLYRAVLRPKATQRELMWVGRLAVALIAVVSIILAYRPTKSIMSLVSFAWAGLGATFAAPVVWSLFWPRATAKGVLAGMLGGALGVIGWHWAGLGEWVYEIIPGLILSHIGLIGVSLLDSKPGPAVLELFRHVQVLRRRA